MYTFCIVCGKGSDFSEDIHLHCFPGNASRATDWCRILFGSVSYARKRTAKICSRHFPKSAFIRAEGKKRLNKYAIPLPWATGQSPAAWDSEDDIRQHKHQPSSSLEPEALNISPGGLTLGYVPQNTYESNDGDTNQLNTLTVYVREEDLEENESAPVQADVKLENLHNTEDVNHSLKIEAVELDEPMLNFYQQQKQADILPQSTLESNTNDTNQYHILTDIVKKEVVEEHESALVQAAVSENYHNSEAVNHSLNIKEEEFNEPMLNSYQQKQADTFPQSTLESNNNDTNQYQILTDMVKKEVVEEHESVPVQADVSDNFHNIEDVNHSLKIEEVELEEPMPNFYEQQKQADTLPQSTLESNINDTNQYHILTDIVKKEDVEEHESALVHADVSDNYHNSEAVNHSLNIKEEEFVEPMLNFYQQRTADCSFENIDLVVKSEIVPVPEIEEVMPLQQELNKVFPGLFCDKCNKAFKTQRKFEKHKCAIGLCKLTCNFCNVEFESFRFLESHQCAKYCATSALSLAYPLDLGSDEEKELELNLQKKQNYTYNKNENVIVKNNDNDLLIQTAVDIEDFEHENDMGADEDYQVEVQFDELNVYQQGSTISYENIDLVVKSEVLPVAAKAFDDFEDDGDMGLDDEDYQVKDEVVSSSVDESNFNAVEAVEMETKQCACLVSSLVYKCKVCAYSSQHISSIKSHLRSHCKDKEFACSKCNRTMWLKKDMLRHRKNCDGVPKFACDMCKLSRFTSERYLQIHRLTKHGSKESTKVISFEDLKDPLKIKNYYTLTKT